MCVLFEIAHGGFLLAVCERDSTKFRSRFMRLSKAFEGGSGIAFESVEPKAQIDGAKMAI